MGFYIANCTRCSVYIDILLIAYIVLGGHRLLAFLVGAVTTLGGQRRPFEFGQRAWTQPTMTDLDALTGEQRTALAQLEAITNGADLDTQISLLESVNWDVQVRVHHSYLEWKMLTDVV